MTSGRATLEGLRRAALEIFYEALKSVDAREALRRAVRLEGSDLKLFDTVYRLESHLAPIYSVAIGKAALYMATALDEILGERLTAGIVAAPVTSAYNPYAPPSTPAPAVELFVEEAEREGVHQPASPVIKQGEPLGFANAYGNRPPLSSRWKVFEGGHPLPNQRSLDAARAAIDLLARAKGEGALIIFLISGGGSAAFEWPSDGRIRLEDLREANRVLVSCGATIAEINSVRRAFSSVKGGGLSGLASSTMQISLIVSDTNPSEESTVASGPTFMPPRDAPDPLDCIKRYHLEERLPAAIVRAVREASEGKRQPSAPHESAHYLLLDNRSAIEAAHNRAEALGFAVNIAHDVVEQPVEEGCSELLSRLHAAKGAREAGFCLISGGEFSCPVRGAGSGGRNAETVLRAAMALEERRRERSWPQPTVILSAGTDGIDGNSPAAGALADETTLERACALGLDARASLDESDAYSFFQALGDAIITGPTGTNVRDLRIMLTRPQV